MKVESKGKLTPLPLGSVKPKGWLLEQLTRSKHGIAGHMPELEPAMILYPYTTKERHAGWGDVQAGWGAEISGNYWYGFMLMAFTLDDPELKKKADDWVEAVLKIQEPDGYMGSYKLSDNRYEDYNAWGTNGGLRALLAYYGATGREDVLEAVHRCLLWFCNTWTGNHKTRYMGITILESMSICYLYTKDERLIAFNREYIEWLNQNDIYLNSQKAMSDPRLIYSSHHSAGYAANLWPYACSYLASGEKKDLIAAQTGIKKVKEKAMHLHGGIANSSEYLAPVSGLTETEYCAFAFFQSSLGYTLSATADPQYADLIERIVFNGAQGARKKDEKAIAYMSAPNQLFATQKTGLCQHLQYAPVDPVSCCPVTSTWIVPNFLANMAHTGADGEYISMYGPAAIDFGSYQVELDTMYPFRDTVTCRIKADKPVDTTLHFRVPGWCENASFAINGKVQEKVAFAGSYYAIGGMFADGDIITLKLPMKVDIHRVDDANASAKFPLAVEYGPLLFSLPVPEDWQIVPGEPRTPLPEGWHWYEVTMINESDPRVALYEDQASRKFINNWNIALDEALDLSLVQGE